jgi:hypothetical protein
MGTLHQVFYQQVAVTLTFAGWQLLTIICLVGAAVVDHFYVDHRYRLDLRVLRASQRRQRREQWLYRQGVGHPAFIKAVDLTINKGLPAYHATVTIHRLETRGWGSPTVLQGAAA